MEVVEVAIAGSVRRGKANPHDVELVLLPKRDRDIFGEELETYPLLDAEIARVVRAGDLQWDEAVKRNGPRLKRFVAPVLEGMPVELYIADENNFGAILAIRTGDGDFSKLLMSPVRWGGCLPPPMRQRHGYLTRYATFGNAEADMDGTVVPVRTERCFFDAIGLPMPEPAYRNQAEGRRLAEMAAERWGG